MSILMDEQCRSIISPRIMKNYFSRRTAPLLAAYGLTPADGPFLMTLGDCRGFTKKELADEMDIDPGLTTRTVGRLIAQGFVANTSTDGRRYSLQLTPHGAEVADRLRDCLDAAHEEMLADLTPAERAELRRLMRIVETRIAADRQGGRP